MPYSSPALAIFRPSGKVVRLRASLDSAYTAAPRTIHTSALDTFVVPCMMFAPTYTTPPRAVTANVSANVSAGFVNAAEIVPTASADAGWHPDGIGAEVRTVVD
ncbi:hypothetical protein ACFQ9R_32870 [Nocardia sp. NPDC056541]|uniref:hypothetical protein n=1 Tax=Nocardia sp. NPDC056541 TaxID=3345860 RepID=UPI00366D5C19